MKKLGSLGYIESPRLREVTITSLLYKHFESMFLI